MESLHRLQARKPELRRLLASTRARATYPACKHASLSYTHCSQAHKPDHTKPELQDTLTRKARHTTTPECSPHAITIMRATYA
eukprot:137224-Pelagomonas_calceolata.AAC.6